MYGETVDNSTAAPLIVIAVPSFSTLAPRGTANICVMLTSAEATFPPAPLKLDDTATAFNRGCTNGHAIDAACSFSERVLAGLLSTSNR